MNKNKSLILILIIVFSNMLTSCEKKDEYVAFVTVVNNSDFQITDFYLNGEGTTFSKKINVMVPSAKENFKIYWIGKQSALFGSKDHSYISLGITYKIENKIFNVQNEKDAKVDSYGSYYSEKQITNRTKINIIIENEQYEIIYE